MINIQMQLSVILLSFTKIFFVMIVLFFILNFKTIKKEFREIKKKTWIILFLILFVASLLRFFWIFHEYFEVDDGFNDLNIAYTIQKHNTHAMCFFVSGDSCKDFFYTTFWPPGYHLALSVVFNIFNPSQEVAFNFSAFLGILSVFLSFLLGYLWTKKEDIALIGAFAFSIIPIILKFSGTVSQNFFSLFIIFFVLFVFEIFLKNKRIEMFFLFLSVLLYAVYSRPENIFLIPIFFFIFMMRENLFEFIKNNKKSFFISMIFLIILIIPIFALVYVNSVLFPQEGWSPSLKETFGYFLKYSLYNLWFFINPFINTFAFSLFVLVGLIFTALKEKKIFLSFFVFFTTFFVIYSSFDLGRFIGSLTRFSLILYIPLFLFFIKGLYFLFSFFENESKEIKRILMVFMVFFLIYTTIPTIPFIFNRSNDAKIFDLMNSIKEKIPDDAYVISRNPSLTYGVTRKNTTNYVNFVNNYSYFKNKNIFLVKDYWWYNIKLEKINNKKNNNHVIKENINIIENNFDFELVESISNNTIFEWGVYKLTRKKNENFRDK